MGLYDDTQKQNAYGVIRNAYKTDLGRADGQISDSEIWSHLDGGQNYQQKNIDYALNNIRNSAEANAYRNRPTDVAQDQSVTETNQAPPPTDNVVYDSDGVTPRRGPLGGGGGGAAAAQAAPAFQPAAAAAPVAPAAQTPAITNQVTELLRKRLEELSNPLDLSKDPVYQGQIREAQVASLRGADRQRAALAERAAATGTRSSGGFDVGVQGVIDNQRETDRGYAANLAGDRLSAREDQLVQAIQMARAVGQDDIANQLELQRLDLQQELGRGDLSLRGELGRGQLNLGYDNLGYNYADMVNRANRDAVLAAL